MTKEILSIDELTEGKIYKSNLLELIKVEKINKDSKIVTLYNISESLRMWLPFKSVKLIEELKKLKM